MLDRLQEILPSQSAVTVADTPLVLQALARRGVECDGFCLAYRPARYQLIHMPIRPG